MARQLVGLVERSDTLQRVSHRLLWAVLCRSSLKRALVKSNAIDWSVLVQMGGQIHTITRSGWR